MPNEFSITDLYIARDADNFLRVFPHKPIRDVAHNSWIPEPSLFYWFPIDEAEFPELKWEDEPIPVKIVSK